MLFYFLVFSGSLILSALLTRLIRDVAVRQRWLDPAGNGRHFHLLPVPRIGGLALYVGFCAAAMLGIAAGRMCGIREFSLARVLATVLMPALLVLLLGLADDLFSLSPRSKLVVEMIAAIWLYGGGLRIHALDRLLPGIVQIPAGLTLTVFWILLITNAFNLVDGLDGLACGSGFIAAIVLFTVSIWSHAALVTLLAAALAGALLGFLRYNFQPATIFLGDSGSLLLGFLVSGLSLAVNSKSGSLIASAALILCFSVPVLDVGIAVIRRFLGSRPLFDGDDEHIHHMLLKRGIPHREAVLILYAVATSFSILGLILLREHWTLLLIAAVTAFGVWRGIRELRYLEFSEIAAGFHRLRLRRLTIANNVRLRRAIESVSKATPEFTEICEILRTALQPIGFSGVAFSLTAMDSLDANWPIPIRADGRGRLVLAWRESRSSHDWELCLPLWSHSGIRVGEFILLRDESDGPLLLDINLLSREFRTSISRVIEAAIQSPKSSAREPSRVKSRSVAHVARLTVSGS